MNNFKSTIFSSFQQKIQQKKYSLTFSDYLEILKCALFDSLYLRFDVIKLGTNIPSGIRIKPQPL